MGKTVTVTITIHEEKPGLWVAEIHDIPDMQYADVPIAVIEYTASEALSRVCEAIRARLNVLRDSGKDWHGE